MKSPALDRLRKLLALHERNAASLRIALALLDEDATEIKKERATDVIKQAIALDGTRRRQIKKGPHRKTGRPKGRPRKSAPISLSKGDIRKTRARTAKTLSAMSREQPMTIEELRAASGGDLRALGSLLRRNYVKRTGDGHYLRTSKLYHADPRKRTQSEGV